MDKPINITLETKISPYMPKELARMYGVSVKTLRTWLLPHRQHIGDRISKYFTAKQKNNHRQTKK